jgi:hypothetical protein
MCDVAVGAVLDREEIPGLLDSMLARSSPGAFSLAADFCGFPQTPFATDTHWEAR